MTNQRTRSNIKIKICTINISGLSSRSLFMLDKYFHDCEFDLAGVQETGPIEKENVNNMSYITDDNQAANKGTMIYINKKHSITKLHCISELSKQIDTTWGLAIIRSKRYIVGSVYLKLNYASGIQELINMLNRAYDLQRKYKASGVIVFGDFNARHPAWGDHATNNYGKELLDKLDHHKYSIHTSKSPTFVVENGGSFIDLMIISNNMNTRGLTCDTDMEVELYSGAPFRGHLPVITKLPSDAVSAHMPFQEYKETISIDEVNWDNWSKDLENKIEENSNYIGSMEDPHELWKCINTMIQANTMKHAKKKISTPHSKPYWTEELTKLSKKLRAARKCYSKRNTDLNKETLIKAKTEFDEKRKEACSEFIMNKAKNLNSVQAQKFWKKFKKLFKEKSDCQVEPLIESNGNIISNNEDIEKNLFATFFEGKHLEMADFDNEFYEEVNRLYENIIEEEEPSGVQGTSTHVLNEEITLAEIRKVMKSYAAGDKSLDNDYFHPRMFRHLGIKALQSLKKLFNQCLNTGEWVWDMAEVIFLKKEGKDTYSKPGSYRPISITSYIGKLYEKIIANRITQHLKRNNLSDEDQEGFTEKRNTVRYLNRMNLEVKQDKNNNKTSIGLFVDFEKAFDSVWKKGLIYKLKKIGITGNILRLINNFLMSRKVTLKVNGYKGQVRNGSEVGVPQGSALSPVLFKIFLMDLASELENTEGIMKLKFADDGTIKVAEISTPKCLQSLDKVLTVVNNWCSKWRMVINCSPNKTEVICFNTAENNKNLVPKTFKLGNKEIKLVSKTTVLGLVMDEDLSYKEHSNRVYKKLQFRWTLVCKYCNKNWGFNQRIMTQLIKTLFLSCLFYAGHIWIKPSNMKEIEKLWYKMIKSSVGAIFNISLAVGEIILGIPPLQIMNQVNKIKHYLKLNINNDKGDRLTEFICKSGRDNNRQPVEIYVALKETFQFLQWKTNNHASNMQDSDIEIINNNSFEKFFDISSKSCSYNKNIMTAYTEYLWKRVVTNIYLGNGQSLIPSPSCKPLAIAINTTRKTEVIMMSLLYDNNLMNNFLYQRNLHNTPVCPICNLEVHTAYHSMVQCSGIDEQYRDCVKSSLVTALGEDTAILETSTTLLNASRHRDFMAACKDIVENYHFRSDIDLSNQQNILS